MIVYHGSNGRFKSLRISKTLVRSRSTELNEGIGIYFSADKNVAQSYGKYTYTLEINDKYLRNFKLKRDCVRYVTELRKFIKDKEKVDLATYVDLNRLADHMRFGGLCIFDIGREIYITLVNNEHWYSKVSEKKQERV